MNICLLQAPEQSGMWQSGLEPEARVIMPGSSSGFLLAIAVITVLILINFRTLRSLVGFYIEEVATVRRGRDNVFDDRPAAAMAAFGVVLGLICVLCGGYMLATGVTLVTRGDAGFLTVADTVRGSFVVLCYLCVIWAAYALLGFTFAPDDGSRREWMRGFVASTALLALGLVIPVLAAVFYPEWSFEMVVIAIILFFIAKILFILKGFRIFFDDFFSLLYFILYLCTLEIIPIILVYNWSVRFI